MEPTLFPRGAALEAFRPAPLMHIHVVNTYA